MHRITNRRTMFVWNEHTSEHALDRIVHPHTSFEYAKCNGAPWCIGYKYAS